MVKCHREFSKAGLQIVAIQGAKPRKPENARKRQEFARTWIRSKSLEYPVLLDPGAAYYAALDMPAGPYPISLLLDAAGRVVWVGDGSRRSYESACRAQLVRILGVAAGNVAGAKPAPR